MKKFLLLTLVFVGTLINHPVFSQTCALNPDFSDASPSKIVDGGTPGGEYEVGDSYLFHNVLTSIHAIVTIEAISNAYIWSIDNNSANSQRFQPFIGSTSSGTEGYVQFAVTFKKASDNSIIPLSQLRLTGFDVDGDKAVNYTISETVLTAGATSLSFNSPTKLTDAGSIADGGFAWRKVVGEAFQYTGTSNIPGISNDPAISFSAHYSAASTFRFRLGYATNEMISAGLDYSVEFGCLTAAPENIPLPLFTLNFSGVLENNKSILNWTTQNEFNLERYELERSLDGNNYVKIGALAAKGANGSSTDYRLTEDLANTSGNIFHYRLKVLDKDGKFTYSKVVSLQRDTKLFNQVIVTPNPVVNGNSVVKINITSNGPADVRVIDITGRTIMLQKINLFAGLNILQVDRIKQLPSGVYTLQLFKDGNVLNTKFVCGR